jgi:hypothetical protein
MAGIEQNDRDISQLITNIKELDAIHGSWGADKSASFVIGDLDHYSAYFVTTTAATVVGTLPSIANNKYRTISFFKIDSGAGQVQISGSAFSVYLTQKGQSLSVQSDGAIWQPKGTIFPVRDADRSAVLVVNTSTNTAGTWSVAVTMTGVPTGAKAALCWVSVAIAGGGAGLWCEAASGYTLSDVTSGTNRFKYLGVFDNKAAGTVAEGPVKIHLDVNGQFKWVTYHTSSAVQIGSAIDYEM